jgi:hypothetical protein
MSSEKKLQAGIAHALWAYYEYGLPESPAMMAKRVMNYLIAEGYANADI